MILAKLMRYFPGQTLDYWLDHGTLHDWADIYHRELRRLPPADVFVAAYFKHEDPFTPEAEELDEPALPEYEA